MSGLVAVTDVTFDELVLGARLPVLLESAADWCPPCRMIEPVLRRSPMNMPGGWSWRSSAPTPTRPLPCATASWACPR